MSDPGGWWIMEYPPDEGSPRIARALIGWWVEVYTPSRRPWPDRATWSGTVRTTWRPTRRLAERVR